MEYGAIRVDRARGKMFGRGSTDDKGPVLGWVNALEAFNQTGTQLPINIKVRAFFVSVLGTSWIPILSDKMFLKK